ncbi:3-oxoacid CoA-transferase [Enterococcus sp. DIV1083b]|uniref:3-oxoacid CoA-transferase n=1 Tax=Enterococcus sp. DIV1083b TaxID=2774661 RepID=UPI003F682A98
MKLTSSFDEKKHLQKISCDEAGKITIVEAKKAVENTKQEWKKSVSKDTKE